MKFTFFDVVENRPTFLPIAFGADMKEIESSKLFVIKTGEDGKLPSEEIDESYEQWYAELAAMSQQAESGPSIWQSLNGMMGNRKTHRITTPTATIGIRG